MLVHNNLGGAGPDSGDQNMRYSNVGSATLDTIGTVHFDLVVTAQTAYTASDPSLNGLNGRFAQINFAANTQVDLRVRVYMSCCTQTELRRVRRSERNGSIGVLHDRMLLLRHAVHGRRLLQPVRGEMNRMNYNCTQKDTPVVLPSTSMVGLSIFDLDTGPTGEYTESVTASNFAYFVSPLRPSSGNDISTTLAINRATGTFTSTATGSPADNPSDPRSLTDVQASRAVQLFFQPRQGYVDMTFAVTYNGTAANPAGRSLLCWRLGSMPAAASVTTGAATDAAIASAAIPSTAAAGHTPAPATVAATSSATTAGSTSALPTSTRADAASTFPAPSATATTYTAATIATATAASTS